ncbi:hypothetical protein HMPREF0946_00926 [Fusobacterium vincentii 3_1_36A2]|jgi:hypothetical protein|uniref:CopG family transcriptional regulator n=1 Tax=Fusobacterium vincentii 3_1_36A2 TaxID=469604 RepID=C7XPW0_FUSVC|nr:MULTISPECIES: hypothetical protein [Fusobacterium]EEU32853.1 hypothetical protein HMPREF0946_00926 [Fusobacterium vincentii 3_1_36A2]
MNEKKIDIKKILNDAKNNKKKEILSFSITNENKIKLKELAKAYSISVSSLIELIIKEFFDSSDYWEEDC